MLRSRVGLGLVLQCSPHPRSVLQGATHPAPTGRGTPSTRAPSRCSSAVYSSRFSLSRYTASSSKLALGNVRNLARQNLVAPLQVVQERGVGGVGDALSPLSTNTDRTCQSVWRKLSLTLHQFANKAPFAHDAKCKKAECGNRQQRPPPARPMPPSPVRPMSPPPVRPMSPYSTRLASLAQTHARQLRTVCAPRKCYDLSSCTQLQTQQSKGVLVRRMPQVPKLLLHDQRHGLRQHGVVVDAGRRHPQPLAP